MPNKNQLMLIAITAIITLVFATKIRSLPLVSKLPTV